MPALQGFHQRRRVAAEAADRIKATDIVAFDVASTCSASPIIMMIAGASNERQVLAVAEEIKGPVP